MARQSHERTSQIQTDAPKQPATQPAEAAKAAAAPPSISWGWQVAAFIWLASFVFLFLNDLLTIVFKLATRASG
jgi:hypothetical protein